jgi:hypothetical protein
MPITLIVLFWTPGIFCAKDLTWDGKQKYGIPSKTIISPSADRNRLMIYHKKY